MRHLNTDEIDDLVKHIDIQVKCVKFQGEELKVPSFGVYGKNEQRLAITMKFTTRSIVKTQRVFFVSKYRRGPLYYRYSKNYPYIGDFKKFCQKVVLIGPTI